MRVIVVGGGVAGLGSALALARAGHEVTVLERDDTPMPTSADDAFEWDRRGAPQVRQSHAFLARLDEPAPGPLPRRARGTAGGGSDRDPLRRGPAADDGRLRTGARRRRSHDDRLPAHDLRVDPAPRRAGGGKRRSANRCRRRRPARRRRRGARHPARRRRALCRRHHDPCGARDRGRRPPLRRARVAHGDRRPRGHRDGRGHGHRVPHPLLPTARRAGGAATPRTDRWRPRLPQVRRVRRRSPHVLGHARHARRRRRAPAPVQ